MLYRLPLCAVFQANGGFLAGFAIDASDTEKVGFGLWWRSCSILYLEVTGGAVLIRKTVAGETQF